MEAVAADFPEVSWDYMHVDAATIFLTTDPARFDVIVTDNLFGDMLSDEAAMMTGSLPGSMDTTSRAAAQPSSVDIQRS